MEYPRIRACSDGSVQLQGRGCTTPLQTPDGAIELNDSELQPQFGEHRVSVNAGHLCLFLFSNVLYRGVYAGCLH